MTLNPSHAVVIDAYEGNGQWIPELATQRVDGFVAQSNRGLYIDKEFRRSHDTCAQRDIPFMGYNQYMASVEWKRQADIQLNAAVGLNVRMLWHAYDSAGGNTGKLNAKTARDSYNAVQYLKQEHGRAGFYGNRSDIMQLYRDVPEARKEALWLARYPLSQWWWNNTENVQPHNAPPAWKTDVWPYKMWQFASEKNWLGNDEGHSYGFPRSWSVDINTWNGTAEEMRAFLGVGQPIPIELTREQQHDILWAEYQRTH